MILPQSRLSRMTLAALATLLGGLGAVHAEPVIGASSAAAVAAGPGSTSTYEYPAGTPPYSYVNSSTGAYDSTGNAYGYAFAHTGGAYAVHSYVDGTGSGSGGAQFLNRFQNLSGVDQHYTLSFHIYGGYISAYSNGYRDLLLGEELSSTYAASLKISLDGGTTWLTKFSSGATITANKDGITATRSGTELVGADNLSTDVQDGYYSWSNAYYTVDLGVVAAGATFDIQADVGTSALANVGTYSFTDNCGGYGYGGYGYGGYEPTSDYECERNVYVGHAGSFYGDPLDVWGSVSMPGDPQGFALNATAPGQLPEPASLALLGLAAGAAGLARRKRQQGEDE